MNKAEFKRKTQELLDQLEGRIEDMKAGINNIADDAREEYDEQLERLKRLREELGEKLGKFDEVAESKWDVVRESAGSFFAKVSDAWKEDFGKVRQAFRKETGEEAEDSPQADHEA